MESDKVVDITPVHEPIVIAKEMVRRSEGCTAAAYVMVDKDGFVLTNQCGHKEQEILWGLVKLIMRLMADE